MTKRRGDSPDWVHRAEPAQGVERIETFFAGNAYAIHRHDTYAIGRTLAGVQCFQYRRSLRASAPGTVTLEELAVACGRDRWSLSRDFRTFYGTSPYHYLTMRRLEAARRLIQHGVALADSVIAAGFAEQSHMTRHLTKAYGITPARWLRMVQHASGR